MKPVIGITTYVEPAKWGQWDLPAALIPYAYVRGVEAAGGRALLVPPSDDGIEETLDALDGVLFTGGGDLDPAHYGAEAHEKTAGVRAERDSAELALLQAALERDMPVLAICRGSQVLNVARGGDLDQHLPESLGHERHKERLGEFSDHEVSVEHGHPPRRRSSASGFRSSRATTRASAGSAKASSRPRRRTTARSKRSRIRRAASRSASSGTPRKARTRRCSRRWSRKRARTATSAAA